MNREFSQRIGRIMTTQTILSLRKSRRTAFIRACEKAGSFAAVSPKLQALIVRAERELAVARVAIYLDIDGVLLNNATGKPPVGVGWFLRSLRRQMLAGNDVYWLTTHCNGNEATAREYLEPYIKKPSLRAVLHAIQPTTWSVKTQGIDFNRPFIWIDDKPLGMADKATMQQHNTVDSLVLVNVVKHPFALLRLAITLRKLVQRAAQ